VHQQGRLVYGPCPRASVGALLRNVLLEPTMASLPLHKPLRLSVDVFRGFLGGRPDEERWELIDGVPVMMAPPTKAHQRIASNLERLLNDALERHDPSLAAYQRTGLNLAPQVEHYDPEPDVAVVDADR